jgi:hypothetical protein
LNYPVQAAAAIKPLTPVLDAFDTLTSLPYNAATGKLTDVQISDLTNQCVDDAIAAGADPTVARFQCTGDIGKVAALNASDEDKRIGVGRILLLVGIAVLIFTVWFKVRK